MNSLFFIWHMNYDTLRSNYDETVGTTIMTYLPIDMLIASNLAVIQGNDNHCEERPAPQE